MKNINSVIRIITSGSVDDGKSTLIGRLLYDTKALLVDQLQMVRDSRHGRVGNNKNTRNVANNSQNIHHEEIIDFSLFTDGLEAEREQGITIDIAYRYFSTANRKFILADCPGHEQYTRNMVTGASNADCAVILIDASKFEIKDGGVELLPQTKRHSAIIKTLDIPHVIVAINKMDLVNYNQQHFDAITTSYMKLANKLGWFTAGGNSTDGVASERNKDNILEKHIHCIPISALKGENIVYRSTNMDWYEGITILQWMEKIEPQFSENNYLRFPVQNVQRLSPDSVYDFRGYQGKIENGSVGVGDCVRVVSSDTKSQVDSIHFNGEAVLKATVGDNITLTLNDDVDISRGDILVTDALPNDNAQETQNIYADICWLDKTPSNISRRYIFQHNTKRVFARIAKPEYRLDMNTLLNPISSESFAMNDLGRVKIKLQKPLLVDVHCNLPNTGGFILIADATHHTVAAGVVVETL